LEGEEIPIGNILELNTAPKYFFSGTIAQSLGEATEDH
jgi:hypothetical protein